MQPAVQNPMRPTAESAEVVSTDDLRHPLIDKWRDFSSPISEFEFVNKAAHWDYQRDRIYVRTSKRHPAVQGKAQTHAPRNVWRVDKVVMRQNLAAMSRCARRRGGCKGALRCRTVHEMHLRASSASRGGWFDTITSRILVSAVSMCFSALTEKLLGPENAPDTAGALLAYVFYQVIELYIPMQTVARQPEQALRVELDRLGPANTSKDRLAEYYTETHQQILQRIISGTLSPCRRDPCKRSRASGLMSGSSRTCTKSPTCIPDSREGGLAQATLDQFKGVLVSDFYAAYDSSELPTAEVPHPPRAGFERERCWTTRSTRN